MKKDIFHEVLVRRSSSEKKTDITPIAQKRKKWLKVGLNLRKR